MARLRSTSAAAASPADPVEAAREAALRLLERSRKTRRELERALRERGHGPAAAGEALDRLARVGLVDDLEYARAYLRSRLLRRPVALRVAQQGLRARGVSPEDVERAVASLAGDETNAQGERARAEQVLAPLLRRYGRLEPRAARERCAQALARRGFDYETVKEVLEDRLPNR